MTKHSYDISKELPIMEYFYTIQGEGFHSGKPAFFIRLAGCDVGCVWCDVKESWNPTDHPCITYETILKEIKTVNADFVVITGGEPAMYDLTNLVNLLHDEGLKTAIETSGCYNLVGDIQWYCFSPKKFKKPCAESYQKAHELKVVINHTSDFQWAEEHADKVNSSCKLYLQPEWSKKERFLPEIINYVKNNPKWKISLQTHKWMDIP